MNEKYLPSDKPNFVNVIKYEPFITSLVPCVYNLAFHFPTIVINSYLVLTDLHLVYALIIWHLIFSHRICTLYIRLYTFHCWTRIINLTRINKWNIRKVFVIHHRQMKQAFSILGLLLGACNLFYRITFVSPQCEVLKHRISNICVTRCAFV